MIQESVNTLKLESPSVLSPGEVVHAVAVFENRTQRRSGKMNVSWSTEGPIALVSMERLEGGAIGKNGSIGTLAAGEVVTIRATFGTHGAAKAGEEIAIQAVLGSGADKRLGSNVVRRAIASAAILSRGVLQLRPESGNVELLLGLTTEGSATAECVNVDLVLSEEVVVLDCDLGDPETATWSPATSRVSQSRKDALSINFAHIEPCSSVHARVRLGVAGKAKSGVLAARSANVDTSNASHDRELGDLFASAEFEEARRGVPFGLGDLSPATLSIGSGKSGNVVPIEISIPNIGTAPVRDVDVTLSLPREIELAQNALRVTGASWTATRKGVQIREIAAGEKAVVEGLVTLHSESSVDVTASASVGDVMVKTSVSIEASALLEAPRFVGLPARTEAGAPIFGELILQNTGSAPAEPMTIAFATSYGFISPSSKDVAALAPASTLAIPVTLRLPASIEAEEETVQLSATVTEGGRDLLASCNIVVYGQPRFEVVARDMAAPATPANPGTLIVVVRNLGTGTAHDVMVRAAVPDGVKEIVDVAIASIAAGEEAEVELPIALEYEVPDRIVRISVDAAGCYPKSIAARVATSARAEIEAALESELEGEEIVANLQLRNAGDGSARVVIVPDVPACVQLVGGSLKVNGRVVRDAYAFERGIVIEKAGPGEEHDVSWVALIDASSANGKIVLGARLTYDGREQVIAGTALRYEGADVFDVFTPTVSTRKARAKKAVAAVEPAAPQRTPAVAEATPAAAPAETQPPSAQLEEESGVRESDVPAAEQLATDVVPDVTDEVTETTPHSNAAEGEGIAAGAAAWLASISEEWSAAEGCLRLTGSRLRQIHNLLLHGRGVSFATHVCAIGSLLPDEVVGAESVELGTVQRQLDSMLVRLQLGANATVAFEDEDSRNELVAFLERAQDARGRSDDRTGTIVATIAKREIAEDLEHLRHAPYGSVFTARALARWIPTSVDDSELAAALTLYKKTLLEELETIDDADGWWMEPAPATLGSQLERLRDAIDGAYQVEL